MCSFVVDIRILSSAMVVLACVGVDRRGARGTLRIKDATPRPMDLSWRVFQYYEIKIGPDKPMWSSLATVSSPASNNCSRGVSVDVTNHSLSWLISQASLNTGEDAAFNIMYNSQYPRERNTQPNTDTLKTTDRGRKSP